jgi:hypothetical protein
MKSKAAHVALARIGKDFMDFPLGFAVATALTYEGSHVTASGRSFFLPNYSYRS